MSAARKNTTPSVKKDGNTIFDNSSERALEFEERYDKFKKDYADAPEKEKLAIVNALVADIAGDLLNYIKKRNRPKDVTPGTLLSRVYLSVARYFTEGSGDPEHYQTGAQFVFLIKRIVTQRICARIRQYVKEHGGKTLTQIPFDPRLASNDDFQTDVDTRELLAILCGFLADEEQNEALAALAQGDELTQDAEPQDDPQQTRRRLTPEEIEVLNLRYKEKLTWQEIADRLGTTVSRVRTIHQNALIRLYEAFKDFGVDEL